MGTESVSEFGSVKSFACGCNDDYPLGVLSEKSEKFLVCKKAVSSMYVKGMLINFYLLVIFNLLLI